MLPGSRIVEVGRDLVRVLAQAGVCARLFGGAAIAVKISSVGFELGRAVKDLDLVVAPASLKPAMAVLRSHGWLVDRRSLMFSDGRKSVFFQPELSVQLDVFKDPLSFNHRVVLGERLTLDSPTLTGADLLLTKLQIVNFTEQDFRDVSILFQAMEVGPGLTTGIDSDRVLSCCARDWGLYYTCMSNLNRLACEKIGENLVHASGRAANLISIIRREDKTYRWKLRSLVGTRMRWYLEVD